MTTQRKIRLVLRPVQIYGVAALLAQVAYRAGYGHEASSAFMSFAMVSGLAAGFLLMIGALRQSICHFRGDAALNFVMGLFFIYATAHLAPYLART